MEGPIQNTSAETNSEPSAEQLKEWKDKTNLLLADNDKIKEETKLKNEFIQALEKKSLGGQTSTRRKYESKFGPISSMDANDLKSEIEKSNEKAVENNIELLPILTARRQSGEKGLDKEIKKASKIVYERQLQLAGLREQALNQVADMTSNPEHVAGDNTQIKEKTKYAEELAKQIETMEKLLIASR